MKLEERDSTYMQDVECEVREWTDNVNVQDKLWFCHNVLLALSIACRVVLFLRNETR